MSDNQSEEVVTINFQENLELDIGEVDAEIEVHGHSVFALPFPVNMSGNLPEAFSCFFATEAEYEKLLRHCDIRYVTTSFFLSSAEGRLLLYIPQGHAAHGAGGGVGGGKGTL